MRVLSIVCLVLALACAVSATQFMSDEHRKLGDLIFRNAARHATSSKELHEAATVLKQIQMKGADRYLQVNPQHLVSFGDLVAMSGDFFAVPTTPISGGKTLADHLRNFEGNYKTFADASDVESTKGYLKVEREIIEARRASGLSYPASYVYVLFNFLYFFFCRFFGNFLFFNLFFGVFIFAYFSRFASLLHAVWIFGFSNLLTLDLLSTFRSVTFPRTSLPRES